MYRSLYEYFRDVVLKDSLDVLDGAQMPSSPTQNQMTTALKTLWTKLGGSFASLLLLTLPTIAALPDTTKWYDVPPETLITNVLDTRPTFDQTTVIITNKLSNIKINGQQLSENVSVTTFAPFPSNWPTRGGTMNALCAAISSDLTAKRGMCFLGEIYSKDKMPDVRLGNCEIIVKICKDGVLNFEAFSTDTGTKHWDGVGYGSSFSGWRQVVTAEEVTENGTYTLQMVVSDNGQTKTYSWVKID